MQSTVDDVMDLVGLPLLGLVPEDASVVLAAASGRLLIDFTEQGRGQSLPNLASRLEGRRVPSDETEKIDFYQNIEAKEKQSSMEYHPDGA